MKFVVFIDIVSPGGALAVMTGVEQAIVHNLDRRCLSTHWLGRPASDFQNLDSHNQPLEASASTSHFKC